MCISAPTPDGATIRSTSHKPHRVLGLHVKQGVCAMFCMRHIMDLVVLVRLAEAEVRRGAETTFGGGARRRRRRRHLLADVLASTSLLSGRVEGCGCRILGCLSPPLLNHRYLSLLIITLSPLPPPPAPTVTPPPSRPHRHAPTLKNPKPPSSLPARI